MRISMAIGYRLAYSRLGVSVGVINDIVNLSGLPKKMFKLVYNPVPIFKEPSKKLINHSNVYSWDYVGTKFYSFLI